MRRWRGLKDLLVEATVHGSRAIERIQLEKSRIPFQILEAIPMTAGPAKVVHQIHDVSVAATHATIRAVASGVGQAADLVIDVVDGLPARTPAAGPGPDGERADDASARTEASSGPAE